MIGMVEVTAAAALATMVPSATMTSTAAFTSATASRNASLMFVAGQDLNLPPSGSAIVKIIKTDAPAAGYAPTNRRPRRDMV